MINYPNIEAKILKGKIACVIIMKSFNILGGIKSNEKPFFNSIYIEYIELTLIAFKLKMRLSYPKTIINISFWIYDHENDLVKYPYEICNKLIIGFISKKYELILIPSYSVNNK